MTSPSTSLRYNSQNSEIPSPSSRNPRKRPTSPLSPRERSRKKRDAFTDDQRRALRQRYQDPAVSGDDKKYENLAVWFDNLYRHKIDKGQVSKILSHKWAHLDTSHALLRPNLKKTRTAHWPELETALFEWQQRMQRKRAPLSGDLLREMALKFWKRLPLYRNQPPPRFSIGWLDSFKRRYKITKHRQHGELGSVKRVEVEEECNGLRDQ